MSNASNNPTKKAVPLFSNRLRELSPKANKRRQCSCISKRTVTTHEELHVWRFHCTVWFYIFYSEERGQELLQRPRRWQWNVTWKQTLIICPIVAILWLSQFFLTCDWYGRKVVKEFFDISHVAVLCYRCLAIARQWYHTVVVAISIVVI